MKEKKQPFTIALAGQPNTGKSTIYNLLTGGTQYVSNWPGKTSNIQVGNFEFQGETIRLVDLPGVYSLSSGSVEEELVRQYLIENRPDTLLVILDAVTLERNLYLVAELLSLEIPLVLVVNRMDMAETQGIHIEPDVLSAALRVPVVPLVALRGDGVQHAVASAIQSAHHLSGWQPNLPSIRPDHQQVLDQLDEFIRPFVPSQYPNKWVALKLLEGDRLVTESMREKMGEAWQQVHSLLVEHDDAFLAVAAGRYDWIARMVRAAVVRPKSGMLTITDRIDRVATHPFWGVLILIAVMAGLFGFTFGLGLPLQSWLEKYAVQAASAQVPAWMGGAPGWLQSLVAHGLIGGVGTVLTLLPILVLFFLGMGLLEDSGYMARAAFVMDRYMHPLGLHGKSFLPLSFGVGCNVPAVMESRIIDEPKARLITILLTPFVPCFPRLSVVVVLAPIFFGQNAFLFSLLLVSLPLIFLVLYGKLMHEVLQKGEHNAFIMELPLYQPPRPKAILRSIQGRIVDFLKGAGTIILLVSVGLWALSYFPGGEIKTSYLAALGHWFDPLSGITGLDWRMAVALVTSLLRSENTLSTLSVLYGVGADRTLSEAIASTLTPASGLAFLAMQILFVPCIATVAAIFTETKSWLRTLGYVLMRLLSALAVGALIYQVCHLLNWGV